MKTQPHFKIVILEDNDFYNKLMTKYLNNYIQPIALIKAFTFEINSFTNYSDCARNFDNETTVVISDYYLNDGYSALNMIDLVRTRVSKCKVVVLSQIENMNTATRTLLEGACEFIHKDSKALEKSAYIIEEIIFQNLKNNFREAS